MAWYRCSNGSSGTLPKIIYAESRNRANIQTFTYTFTSSGKYQYYVWNGITSDASSIIVKLNGTVISPLTYFGNGIGLFYNEIEVQSNDILTVETTTSGGSAGVQFFLLQNADVTQFAFLGSSTNNPPTSFAINTNGKPYLQVFQYSYQGTRNSFNYDIFQYSTLSIAVPNTNDYYYGGTYAIAIK